MGTLIKMKAEVANHELPVVTEHGIMPYYAGVYVNKLADIGITFTQTEVNALAAFINALDDAGVLNKIDSFYPFMGNVNVPLIGNTELTFGDTTPTNTKLDFVDGKLRGVKAFDNMPTVKYKNLSSFSKGFNMGFSMISKALNSETDIGSFFEIKGSDSYPVIQARFKGEGSKYNFIIINGLSSSTNIYFQCSSNLSIETDLHNYAGVYGIVNANHTSESIAYTRTTMKDGNIINSEASYIGAITPFKTTDIAEFNIATINANANNGRVMTTLVFFNELLTADQGKVFCQALDTFTAAVGKTVAVG